MVKSEYLRRIYFLEVFDARNDAICDLRFIEERTPNLFAEATEEEIGKKTQRRLVVERKSINLNS